MDLSEKKDILRPMFRNEDFLESLTRDYGDQELNSIYYQYYFGFCFYGRPWIPLGEYSDVGSDFGNWLADEIREEGIDVLTIRSFKNGLSQGRKGTLAFRARFDLVMSCDYDDDHIEAFKKEDFSPWKQKDFQSKSILVTSEIYSREEILEFLDEMFDIKECEISVIGRVS